MSLLDTTADGEVLAALAQWPALLREAGDLRAPHRVAHYLEDLAATYHKCTTWSASCRWSLPIRKPAERKPKPSASPSPEPARAAARLKLNDAVQTVIAEGSTCSRRRSGQDVKRIHEKGRYANHACESNLAGRIGRERRR